MAEKKKNIILKVFLIILSILFLSAVGLFVFYRVTRKDVRKYIPKDFIGLLKVDSLSKTYEDLIDLKASDVILSKDEYKDIFKLIQNIRVSKASKNRLFIGLINISSYILIDRDYSPSFVFDVGIKSLFLNAASVFSGFIGKNEDFSLEKVTNETNTSYKIIFYKNNLTLFLSFKNNLVFLSFKEGSIEDIYRANLENKTIYYDDDFFHIRSRVKKNSLAEIYFNTNEVINSVSKNFPDLNNITQKFIFENNTGISANISNENISLNTCTKISTEDPIARNFLNDKPLDMRVTKYLPEDTNIYADINFKSFEEFYRFFLYLQGGKFDETIEKVNSAAKIFFGGDINELLFSWIGNEAGFFSSSVSNSPVIFFSIKDRGKMNRTFENIYKSNLIQHETNLVYEGVKLDKTKLPDFLLWIVDSFYKGFDTPYYVVKDDFIFFSMEPDPLSNLVNKFDSSKTLVYDNMYKKITLDVEKKANVFLYFNLGISIPKFLNNKTIITEIIKIYEKGTFSINFNGDALRLDFSAAGINEKKIRLFPGYPKLVTEGISTEVMCKNILGSGLPELLYVRKDDKLVVADINNFPTQGFPVHIEGGSVNLPAIIEDKIVCFTQNNYLHKFDFCGLEESPYPVKIDFNPTFYPKRYKNKFILFNGDDKKIYFYNDDNTFSDFNFEFKSPLLSPPEILNNNLLFYPKNFSGTIFFTDENGFILSGWPKETGSIAFGSPVASDLDNDGSKEIIFINQNGNLSVLTESGYDYKNFPVKLDGVFYNQAVTGDVTGDKNREIAALDKEGNLFVISCKGDVIGKIKIKDVHEKDTRLCFFDVNKDKKDEIIVYGGGNNVYCYSSSFSILPGFPVKGSSKPNFADFNGDGEYEMVVSSFDKNIYVYSIPKD